MSKNLKLSIGLIALALAALVAASALSSDDKPEAPTNVAERNQLLVRSDSQRLTSGSKATFVEFLDFECEACGAIYPTIEELKETYGDRVTFVVRYMPLHTSSVNAARAAEAAAAQDRFEDMYDLLFQRQPEWGHKETPERDRFFAYAQELGLDMAKFETDFGAEATLRRIEQSKSDGRALGVTGTPTMFMNGKRLEPKSLDDLTAAFDAAVA